MSKKKKPKNRGPRAKIKISLCMIVRDEESCLSRCLSSAVPLVDEIVVVDTGSVDQTVKIAKDFGASVIDFEWQNDFSKARNVSLDHAKGEWILFLDADEELAPKSCQLVRQTLKANKTFNRFFFTIVNFQGENSHTSHAFRAPSVRLFRNRQEYRFKGAIHEDIMFADGNCGTIDTEIWHYGYLDGEINKRQKHERNANLVEKNHADDNDYSLFLAANEEYQRGSFKSALEKYFQAYAGSKGTRKVFADRLLLNIIKCCYQLDLFDELNKWVEIGLARCPRYTDLEYGRAVSYLKQENYAGALESYNACLALGEPPMQYGSQSGVGSWLALTGIGICFANVQQPREAVTAWLQALKINPLAYYVMEYVIDTLLHLGYDEQRIRQKLESFIDLDTPEAKQVLEESLRINTNALGNR